MGCPIGLIQIQRWRLSASALAELKVAWPENHELSIFVYSSIYSTAFKLGTCEVCLSPWLRPAKEEMAFSDGKARDSRTLVVLQ